MANENDNKLVNLADLKAALVSKADKSIVFDSVDIDQPDNGITSQKDGYIINAVDKNGHSIALLYAYAYPDGTTSAMLSAGQPYGDGSSYIMRGLRVDHSKSGVVTYKLSNPENFRTAIGALSKDISNLSAIPSDPASGDILLVERGTTTYKIDYDALAAAILNQAVKKTGDTMTGVLTTNSDIVQTAGLLRGYSGDKAHSIKLGHYADNKIDFNEYGGVFNFNRYISDEDIRLLFQIAPGVSAKPLPVSCGGTDATDATTARVKLGIFIRNVNNTGGRPISFKRTALEQVFLVIGTVSNTTNNRMAILATGITGVTTVYETSVVGSKYNPTMTADGVITLVDKRTYECFIIISTHAFTIEQS